MGMFDDIKGKAEELVDSQGEKVGEGIDKAGDLVDQQTGGTYGAQIHQGAERAKDALDGLDGKNDDIP